MSRLYIYPEQEPGRERTSPFYEEQEMERRQERRGRESSRMAYGGYDGGYEGRSRMRGGMEGRAGMVHPNYETLPRARRGRDSRGRYTSAYAGYDNADEWYEAYPSMEGDRRVIGFTGTMSGMQKGQSPTEMGGHSWEENEDALTMDDAREWVESMHGSKGKKGGEHWSFDQTTNLLRQRGFKHDPAEWYAIMHAVYYDFCDVAMKYGLAKNDEYFADLAHAWLDDEDAVENKAAVYYDCIVE